MAETLLEKLVAESPPNLSTIRHSQDVDDPAEEVTAFMGSLRPFWGRVLIYIVLFLMMMTDISLDNLGCHIITYGASKIAIFPKLAPP